MGTVIDLEAHRAKRRPARSGGAPVAGRINRSTPVLFAFDVASPWTYLAAEGVERLFGQVEWRPVDGELVALGREAPVDVRARAEARAATLRLPLVWPERPGGDGVRRASAFAASIGHGGPFALAAGRLAYGGGFCLDDPDTLAEAAAAAGLPPAPALLAAADPAWDDELAREAGRIVARGAEALPALILDGTLVCGEDALAAAVARAAAG